MPLHFTADYDELRWAVHAVQGAISSNATMPILRNALIEVKDGIVGVTATNLQTVIKARCNGTAVEEGAHAVDAVLLDAMLGAIAGGKIEITIEGDQAHLVAPGTDTLIAGIDAGEFPDLLHDTQVIATIAGETLIQAIKETAICAAPASDRPVLHGVLVRCRTDGVTLAATDGFRLAERILPDVSTVDVDLIVPSPLMMTASETIDPAQPVALAVNDARNLLRLEQPRLTIDVRLIDGEYPNYARLLPQEHATKVTVSRDAVTRALRQCMIIANANTRGAEMPAPVMLTVEQSLTAQLHLNVIKTDVGSNKTTVLCALEGDPTRILCNPKMLQSVIGVSSSNDLDVLLNGEKRPLLVRPSDGTALLHMVMPMAIK